MVHVALRVFWSICAVGCSSCVVFVCDVHICVVWPYYAANKSVIILCCVRMCFFCCSCVCVYMLYEVSVCVFTCVCRAVTTCVRVVSCRVRGCVPVATCPNWI